MRYLIFILLAIIVLTGFYGLTKSLPSGLDIRSDLYPIAPEQVQFFADRTYRLTTNADDTIFEHTIFDTMLEHVAAADRFVLVDMFLFNDHQGSIGEIRRSLSQELTEALIAQNDAHSEGEVYVVSDPINGMYGTLWSEHFAALESAEVPVIITDLKQLPDSNPLYSAFYRAGLQHMPAIGGSILPNIFDAEAPGMHLRAYTRLLNFKANHRKVMVTGGEAGWRSIVTSMNAHDGSSRHSNVALEIRDHPVIRDIIRSEQAVLNFSLATPPTLPIPDFSAPAESDVFIQLLTERAIKESIITRMNSLDAGDRIDLAAFYISDRDIVRALKDADDRGVSIRILLDPNRDAFGREKNGIPNRQVAHELMRHTNGNTTVRWCVTQGEQCHSKFKLSHTDEDTELILGSANFTKRNLENRNLETNIRLVGPADTPALADTQAFFDEQWGNHNNRSYSTAYDTFADPSRLRTVWYHIGEFTGMSHY